MKELLQPLAVYNLWANQRTVQAVLLLPEEKQLMTVVNSFDSLHKTILHLWDAESIWWQRIKLHERVVPPGDLFKGITREAADGLIQQSKQWSDWVTAASEVAIDHVFQYYNSKKECFKMPVYQALQHVFNHSTYHRGQIVTILRQLGVTKIPQCDFAFWLRTSK